MKKFTLPSLIVLFLFSSSAIYAQQENVDTAAFRKIRNAEMSSSQIPVIAHYLTDVAGSRLTNSPGYTRAGKWAVESMKKWGMVKAAFEPWGEYGRGWEQEEFNISMKVPYQGYIVGYPLPWSSNTPGEVRGPVYEITMFNLMDSAYLEKHKADIKGKIILLTSGSKKHEDDIKPFAERLTDSALMKMPDSYMMSRQQLDGGLKYFALMDHGRLQLKDFGALAVMDADGSGRDGTVTVQGFFGYKAS